MDPALVEVIRGGMVHTCEEMGIALRRSAYSPNIKERLDFSCCVFDAEARLVAQAEHIPVHLGSMPFAVTNGLRAFGRELGPGDMLVFNDPYISGTHLPDITLVSPVFYEGDRVGYVANKAHHSDVGGSTPGSLNPFSTTLEEEGIVMPPRLMVSRGELRKTVIDEICSQVWGPEMRRGDLMAQLAANHVGSERMSELVGQHGAIKVTMAGVETMTMSEARMRSAIRSMPEGTFEGEDVIEFGDDLYTIRLAVTVEGDSMTFDYEGTDTQMSGAMNAPLGVTISGVFFSLLSMMDPGIQMNQGCFEPVEVRVPEGSILNPVRPAAVAGGNVETSQRNVDVIFSIMGRMMPERAMAQGQGTMNNVCVGGFHGGESWAFYETIGGGQGATRGLDGADGVQVNMTNTMNTPMESMEATYPVRFRRYVLVPDSCGPGQWRGGCGIERSWELLADEATLTLMMGRSKFPPRGIEGGRDGSRSLAYVVRDDLRIQLASKTVFSMKKGDVLVVKTPGGGGYGDPRERDEEARLNDIRQGLVSCESAIEDYGIDLEHDPQT